MKTTQKLICAVAVFCSTATFAQEGKPAEMSAEDKAYMEYMTPGPAHKELAASEGIWSEDLTMWMAPGAPEVKSTATVANKMIMGGRYLQGMHRGTMMGMPFEGMNIVGYDNKKGVYQSTWIDNMGTGIMMLTGTWNKATNMLESKGTMIDPVTGADMQVRETYFIKDNDHHIMEMFMTTANGKEYKSMHIEMVRKPMKPTNGISNQPPPRPAAPGKGDPAKTQDPSKVPATPKTE